MSHIDTKGKTLLQILSEQFPYIKDFEVREDHERNMISVTYSHSGYIDESFDKLMRYIAPGKAYRLTNTEIKNAKS